MSFGITVKMDADGLVKALDAVSKNISKELGIVSWKTAKKTKSFISKEVTTELAAAQKDVKKHIHARRVRPVGAEVWLDKSDRMSLKRFKPRQTKKGVSYRISKTKGRTTAKGAFGPKIDKLGNHVYHRQWKYAKGGDRKANRAIGQKLLGPSPWGVFVRRDMIDPVRKKVVAELQKQMRERLRYRKLKHSGAI